VTTKFEEMRESVDQGISKWAEYRSQCIKDMNLLVRGFLTYCGIPHENVSFSPLDDADDKEAEERRKFGMVGAMHWGPDGFWHLGLVIKLHPFKSVLIELCVNNNKGKLFVKAGHDGKPRELDLANQSQCEEFYEGIVQNVKAFFGTRIDEALDKQPSTVRIGFL
jgi:hypothetical protein